MFGIGFPGLTSIVATTESIVKEIAHKRQSAFVAAQGESIVVVTGSTAATRAFNQLGTITFAIHSVGYWMARLSSPDGAARFSEAPYTFW
jgi:hypothetical protein